MPDAAQLKKYVEEKIEVSGFGDQEKDEIIEAVIKNISTAINIAIFEQLDKNDQKTFSELAELATGEKLTAFIQSKVKNLPMLVNETIDKTIAEFNELRKQ